jgi:hypothetical protein
MVEAAKNWYDGLGKWSIQAVIALVIVGGFVAGTLGVAGVGEVSAEKLLALGTLAGAAVNHYFPGGKKD